MLRETSSEKLRGNQLVNHLGTTVVRQILIGDQFLDIFIVHIDEFFFTVIYCTTRARVTVDDNKGFNLALGVKGSKLEGCCQLMVNIKI